MGEQVGTVMSFPAIVRTGQHAPGDDRLWLLKNYVLPLRSATMNLNFIQEREILKIKKTNIIALLFLMLFVMIFLGCGGTSGVGGSPATSHLVYMSANSVDGASVYAIDTSSNTIVATIPVGSSSTSLTGIAVNSAINRAYVTAGSIDGASVYAIDTSTNTIVATIPVANPLTVIAVNSTTNRAYVASGSVVYAIDTSNNTIVATIPLGSPSTSLTGIAVS